MAKSVKSGRQPTGGKLMPNCKTVIPYQGTPEQEAKLKEVIAAHKGQPGATMPVLQAAQEIFGYLPEEVQKQAH